MNPFPPGASLNAYLRDSGGDSQDLSIPQQLAAIRAWCSDHGLILVHIFQDAARPGSSVVGRQGFQDMMHHFRSPACQEIGLIVWNYQRFARDIDDSQFFRADLRRRGYILHSLNDPVPDGPMGRLFEAAIDWKNEQFLEDLSRDVKRGLHDLVLTHRAVPGTPPRGFARQPVEIGRRRDGRPRIVHRWVPDLDTAPLVRLAFQMRLAGRSLAEINAETHLYKALNGYKTFFTNPLYKGELHFGDLVIPDYCQPVVDPDLWEAVQAIVRRHAARRNLSEGPHPRRVASSYLLSGLSYCARCNSPHYGLSARQPNGSTYRRYACTRAKRNRDCNSRPIPALVLERSVLDQLRQEILQPAFLDSLRQSLLAGSVRHSEQLHDQRRALSARLGSLRQSITRLTDAIAEAGHSRALLDKLAALEAQEADQIAAIARLDHALASEPLPPDLDHHALAAELRTRLDSEDPQQVRQVLHGLVYRLLVDRDQTTLTGLLIIYYPPHPPPKA